MGGGLLMFAEYHAECQALARQAKGELVKLHTVPENERHGLSTAAFELLKRADDSLKAMELEVRAAPANERAQLVSSEEALRAELRAVAVELEQVRRELLLGPGTATTSSS